MIAAEHDLADANLRGQVAQRFGTEDQRIEIQLLQVFGRFFLQRDVRIASRRVDETGVVRPVGIGRQKPAAMRRDDLEAREAVERPLEDQMRQCDRGFGRQTDRVRQPAIALEALGQLRDGSADG